VVDGSSNGVQEKYVVRHADNHKKVPSDDVIVLSPLYAFFCRIFFTSILYISFVQVLIAKFLRNMFLVVKETKRVEHCQMDDCFIEKGLELMIVEYFFSATTRQ
jgi:hypothetical protein